MQNTLSVSRSVGWLAPLGLLLPSMPAAAFEWGAENWGESIWGSIVGAISVPAMPAVLIAALAVLITAVAARRIGKLGKS